MCIRDRVNGKGSIVEEINNYLTGVRATIFNIHQEIEQSGREITADLLKRRFLAESHCSGFTLRFN